MTPEKASSGRMPGLRKVVKPAPDAPAAFFILWSARYYDVWNDRELQPQIHGHTATLSLRVEPHDLGCVVQMRE